MADVSYVKAFAIKNQWINFSLYFINFMYKTKKRDFRNKVCGYDNNNDFWIVNKYHLKDNNNPIGGKEKNNKFLAFGNRIKTCFIEVDKTDLINFFERPELGFRIDIKDLVGRGYARAENPNSGLNADNTTNQERLSDDPASTTWNDGVSYYFLKGANNNDIFQYLIDSKIV
jgi:hypothetical protein